MGRAWLAGSAQPRLVIGRAIASRACHLDPTSKNLEDVFLQPNIVIISNIHESNHKQQSPKGHDS